MRNVEGIVESVVVEILLLRSVSAIIDAMAVVNNQSSMKKNLPWAKCPKSYLPLALQIMTERDQQNHTLLLNCPPLSVAVASDLVEVCGSVDLSRSLFEVQVVGRIWAIWPMGGFFSYWTGC